MTKDQVIDKIRQYGLNFDDFLNYMRNKTYSIGNKGQHEYNRNDVNLFISKNLFQK